jgi:hypothetical protein
VIVERPGMSWRSRRREEAASRRGTGVVLCAGEGQSAQNKGDASSDGWSYGP